MDYSVFSKGSFFLLEIGEPEDNVLRLVVAEARTGEPMDVVNSISAAPILPATDVDPIELTWTDYVAYAVLNESFTTGDPNVTSRSMLERRPTSAFLDYVAQDTFASPDYPGPFEHWEFVCLNHVVNVAAMRAPEIRRVSPDPKWFGRDGPSNFQRSAR